MHLYAPSVCTCFVCFVCFVWPLRSAPSRYRVPSSGSGSLWPHMWVSIEAFADEEFESEKKKKNIYICFKICFWNQLRMRTIFFGASWRQEVRRTSQSSYVKLVKIPLVFGKAKLATEAATCRPLSPIPPRKATVDKQICQAQVAVVIANWPNSKFPHLWNGNKLDVKRTCHRHMKTYTFKYVSCQKLTCVYTSGQIQPNSHRLTLKPPRAWPPL